jgi:hypothetical protein
MRGNAVLVLAHRDPALCARLVARLLALGSDVFLHVDVKVPIDDYSATLGGMRTSVTILERRHDSRWGGFRMTEATLDLLRAARASGPHARYTLLSGDTYPVKARARISAQLASGNDFISLRPVGLDERKYQRIERVYIPDLDCGSLRPGWVERHVNPSDLATFAALPAILKGRRPFLDRYPYFVGSQWWSLTSSSVTRLLDFLAGDPDFLEQFRYSSIPDEAFFQTAYVAAGLRGPATRQSLVAVDWTRSPKPFLYEGPEHLQGLLEAPQVFARKFSEKSGPLLDLLDAAFAA